ncbi:DUF3795 domain-containing protein [candidate division KSB1 bacterium]|nr:DUF3795 domain-containing protein [candidate division KSB1 bacterium]RQW06047.1 MAG: DUF3795 domain-containing protein [candidate division KSB1 bacterium]
MNRPAYCGINCDKCPIHLATLESDPAIQVRMRTEIADLIWQKYEIKLSAAEITDCDGCVATSERLFTLCQNCPIRACARQKGHANCAECDEYGCGHLLQFFTQEPDAKIALDRIRSHC